VDRADPDLFARGRKPLCVARCILTIATGRGEALHNLDVAQQYLADRPEVGTERIEGNRVLPGGGFALLLAMTGR
jgi:carboxymethylenebutenolidase